MATLRQPIFVQLRLQLPYGPWSLQALAGLGKGAHNPFCQLSSTPPPHAKDDGNAPLVQDFQRSINGGHDSKAAGHPKRLPALQEKVVSKIEILKGTPGMGGGKGEDEPGNNLTLPNIQSSAMRTRNEEIISEDTLRGEWAQLETIAGSSILHKLLNIIMSSNAFPGKISTNRVLGNLGSWSSALRFEYLDKAPETPQKLRRRVYRFVRDNLPALLQEARVCGPVSMCLVTGWAPVQVESPCPTADLLELFILDGVVIDTAPGATSQVNTTMVAGIGLDEDAVGVDDEFSKELSDMVVNREIAGFNDFKNDVKVEGNSAQNACVSVQCVVVIFLSTLMH